MVVKRKSEKSGGRSVTAEASAPLEEAAAKEEKRPAVTQVVEVVEETPQTTPSEMQPPVEPVKPLEIPAVGEAGSTPSSIAEEPIGATSTPTADQRPVEEKRKEVVDELFQNKQQPAVSVMPEISVHTKRSGRPILMWAIVLIVACLVAGVSLMLVSGKKGLPSIVAVPTPTATPAVKPTSTASQSAVKRSDITIQVLNGGGVAGAANKMKALLEGKGYTVSDTGNADSYTYTKTEVVVKATKKAYISLLEGDLGDTYSLGTPSSTLDNTASYDARVIVGKE